MDSFLDDEEPTTATAKKATAEPEAEMDVAEEESKRATPEAPTLSLPPPSTTTSQTTPLMAQKRKQPTEDAASSDEPQPEGKRLKTAEPQPAGDAEQDTANDSYCWICHKEGQVICCETCPRVFHLKCIQLETAPTEDWVCPECVLIMTAENMDTRSRAMRLLNIDQLCILLKYALARMRSISSVEPFVKPVEPKDFPSYRDYVSFPMDLQTIEKNVKKKHYGSTEAFLADTKWILHNCIIFNSASSKLTSVAKSLVKVCKHEMQEIENCPDCYTNAHVKKDSWFVAACRVPHLLVWAKLKGFPFWPGKAMRVNSEDNVDVRFFGAHDRAWIPLKDVYLYSEEPPVLTLKSNKKKSLDGCGREVETYIANISERFGRFEYAAPKTPLDPKREEEQIHTLYPNCTLPFELGPGGTSLRRRVRTFSFSGSERSQNATPTPSDAELSDQDQMTKPPTVIKEPTPAAQEQAPKAVSPPCEVSSTTTSQTDKVTQAESKTTSESSLQVTNEKEADVEKMEKVEEEKAEEKKDTTTATENKQVKVAVIAETSEKVEIETENNDVEMDEEAQIIDDEEIEEIDDVEPEKPKEAEKVDKTEEAPKDVEKSPLKEAANTTSVEAPNTTSEAKEEAAKETTLAKTPQKSGSEDEEIDDVEPDVEEILDDDDEAAVDTSRLLASGVSVTVVDKKDKEIKEDKPKKSIGAAEEASNAKSNSGDLSVTVVQKKKIEITSTKTPPLPTTTTATTPSSTPSAPRISVKKESELLESSKLEQQSKDVVNVHIRSNLAAVAAVASNSAASMATITSKAKKSFPGQIPQQQRKSSDSIEAIEEVPSSKRNPPDPIVTISKVQSLAVDAANKSKPPTPSSTPRSSPASAPGSMVKSSVAAPVTAGSLASILGAAPRMSTPHSSAPQFHPRQPHPAHQRPVLPPGGAAALRLPPPGSHLRPQTGPGMPSLHPRPGAGLNPAGSPSAASTPPSHHHMLIPPAAGPVSEQMHKMAGKMVDFMRGTLEDYFRELGHQGSPEAQVKVLQLEMEKMQWRHQQELSEMKHNADLMLLEMRQSMQSEKAKEIADLKKQADVEKMKAITETKKKQWCAHCGKEAIFYCCWNTSYCDYPCQVNNLHSYIIRLFLIWVVIAASALADAHGELRAESGEPRR